MYLKEFEIRWNDLDANRHLANSAFVNYMTHTRMSFLMDNGMDYRTLASYNIGPVVFHEHLYYYKEAVKGRIKVSFELGGLSEDGMFFKFLHNFYDENGKNLAFCEMKGGWMDLKTRSLIGLPSELRKGWEHAPKSEDFTTLTKADMRTPGRSPRDL